MGLRAWPRFDGRRWGAGLDVSAGTGLPVDRAGFHGGWGDVSLAPSLRLRWRPFRRLTVEPAIGASIHFSWLVGTLGAQRVQQPHFYGATDAGLSVTLAAASRIDVGVGCSGSFWFRYPVFVVNDHDLVLSLTHFSVDGGAVVRLRID
jgi:hypothetical protein